MSELSKFHPLKNRRERRIERRRGEIATAAASLFAEQGFAATTTKDIAEAADMAEGTLYNYFDSKRDILLAIVNRMQKATMDMLAEAGKVQREEDVIDLVDREMELFLTHLDFTRTIIMEVWVDDDLLQQFLVVRLQQMRKGVSDFLTECIQQGVFRPIDPNAASGMLMGMFIVPMLPALRGVKEPPTPQERRAIAQTVVSVFLDGVRVRA